MTTDDTTEQEMLNAVADGLDKDDTNLVGLIKGAFSGSRVVAARETAAFLKRLLTEETPDDPEDIMAMSKDEMVIAIYRINLFEKLRHSAVDDDQIEQLYQRTVELWGEAPTEPIGRWAEWNLWMTRHRRRNGIKITEVIQGEKTVEDIGRKWVKRHEDREEQRKLHKMVNYEQYEVPEDVPDSLRHIVFSPFIRDKDVVSEVDVSATAEVSNIDLEAEADAE